MPLYNCARAWEVVGNIFDNRQFLTASEESVERTEK